MRLERIVRLLLGVASCADVKVATPVSLSPPTSVAPTVSAPAVATTTPVSPGARVVVPPVDFESFEAMNRAMEAAVGKRARLSLRRDHYTSSGDFTAEGCDERGSMRLDFAPEQRDFVRAMHDDCATVTFTIKSIDPRLPWFEGTIERFDGITPKGAARAPNGADFASLDDAILAGDDAKDKIVLASVWAYDGDPKLLWVNDCDHVDSFVFVRVSNQAERALASRLSRKPGTCRPARLKIVDPRFTATGGSESMARPRATIVN
jgi:hypothetical protein